MPRQRSGCWWLAGEIGIVRQATCPMLSAAVLDVERSLAAIQVEILENNPESVFPMPRFHGPWQVLKSNPIYKDPWIEVHQDDVIRPDGKPGSHSVVIIRQGVSVLLLDDDQFVYLTEEFHYGVGRTTLEVVSGGIDDGEDPLTGAKREALEELGITARHWTPLGTFDPFTTMINSPTQLFLGRRLSFGESTPEGTERIRCVKVPLEEAVEMVMDSRITHGPSCAVILKTRLFLEREGGASEAHSIEL